MSVRLKNACVEKMPLNIRIQWNARTTCVSECVLKTLSCRGLRVGPSKRRMSETPSTTASQKKYCDTPPICIAIRLQFVLQRFRCHWALRKGKYFSTPPICIAVRLPFVWQYVWENLGGCGHRDAPQDRLPWKVKIVFPSQPPSLLILLSEPGLAKKKKSAY